MHGRYCWQRWRGSVVLQHLGLEPLLTAFLTLPAVGGNTLSTSGLGRFLVFLYIWLPFMILPVQAALERLPPSLLQASADPAHVHDKPFAMWCCRWQSRVLPLALSLPSHSHWAILSSRSWLVLRDILSAIWFIPSRGRLAICRWRHSPRCRLFSSHCTAFVKRLGAFDAL